MSNIDAADTQSSQAVASESTADSTLDQSTFQEQSTLPTPKHEFQVHQQMTSSFVFLHDNVHIVSGTDTYHGDKGTMHKWDCKTGLLVGEPWERKSRGIGVLALSPDGKTIACSGVHDRTILRWNTNGEIVKGIWPDDGDHVQSLSWSPCGGRLASGSKGGIILIRNAENEGEDVEVGPIMTKQGWVSALAYSPLGDKIASGGSKETICIWDANTGKLLQGPINNLGSVFSVVWSWDGSKIYSADRFVRILDSNSGAELHRFEHFNFPRSIALSPKHNLLAAVGCGGAAQLWDTVSHQPLGHPFHHEDHQKLTRVSFSQDGQYLAYCGLNHKITLWMVKDIIPKIDISLEVDATNPIAPTVDQPDNIRNDVLGFSEPSRPFAVYGFPHPSQHLHVLPSLWQRLWNILSIFSLFNLLCARPRRKVDGDDPLCSTCSTLDFCSIIRNGIGEDDAVPLGYLTDIIKKRDQCGLCRLIATHFSQCGINLRMITCKLYAPGERSLVGRVGGGHNGLLIKPSRDGFTLAMRLLRGTDSKVWGPKWSHGQRVGQNVDANQLKGWIHTCKKNHRETCESDWWRDGGVLPNTVRVVDVTRMAIVPVPPSCHFVALSYVWGGMASEEYWTTQANVKQRSAPGGLDASLLPDTISDSILLVRQLGERYLWIDSLCIVQDDPSDKAVQIGVMELIYGSAEFTIFAAAGTSRDPLPGVRPSTRDPKQHIAKIQGLQLALPLPNAKKIITHSTWNKRGWTYQEVMLSRRRIFFTAKQVYFECMKEIRSEEMLPQPGFAISRLGMSGLGQIIPKTRSAHVHLTCGSYLRPYMKIVEEFTQRKLTFQSDIVDAVEALLRGLTKAFELADGDYDKAFKFGMLLTGCLDDALLWQPSADAPHLRRVPTKVMWPSWSWAAWQGAVRYVSDEIYHDNQSLPRFKFGQSLVEWYIVNENGQLVHQYVDHRKGILERNSRLATNTAYVAPKGDIDSQQLMTKDVPLMPGTLVFRTSFSRFDVTLWWSDIQRAGAGVNYAVYSILSDIPLPSTRVGRIILPSSTGSLASHEFIVLSRSAECSLRVYDDQRLGESYYGCMLYVMAVQKMQDNKRFERVGVGIVFEQAWVESAPEEKVIYLG